MWLAKARMEIPRITPGITRGASIIRYRACLPGKRTRSIKKAFTVPTSSDATVTHKATLVLVQMLPSNGRSPNKPTRCGVLLQNQSRVKPFQGGAG